MHTSLLRCGEMSPGAAEKDWSGGLPAPRTHDNTPPGAAATGGPASSCEQAGGLGGEQSGGLVLGTLGCRVAPTETAAADGGSAAGVAPAVRRQPERQSRLLGLSGAPRLRGAALICSRRAIIVSTR